MTQPKSIEELKSIASQVRRDIVRMVHAVQSGHPGGSLGCTDFMVGMYFNIMDHNSDFKEDGVGEDLFFLSNGHVSPLWYSVLAHSGYFNVSELGTFRKIGTRLQGHPATEENLPGIRVASGSLGQGLSVAIGAAQTKKLNGDNHIVYVLMGDGEQQEGQVWEAALNASHNKVDNIIATIDFNGQQIDGSLESVISIDNLRSKYESFNWEVIESDGNDMSDIIEKMQLSKTFTGKGKPVINIMHTVMGKGVDFMEGTHKWHGIPPSDEQLADALDQLEETLGDY